MEPTAAGFYYLIIFAFIFGIISEAIANKKGIKWIYFVLGFLFGPFGILFALVAQDNKVPCPFCREKVSPEAIVCPHCQRDLKSSDQTEKTEMSPENPGPFKCFMCGKEIPDLANTPKCPQCGYKIKR